MAYYHTCPRCGANLDPGERCECREPTPEEMQAQRKAPCAADQSTAQRA